MQFPDELLKCLLFIGHKIDNDKIKYCGTGFLVSVPHNDGGKTVCFPYLITAKHVVEEIKNKVIYVRASVKGDNCAEEIPLGRRPENGVIWYYNPTDSTADVAVTPFLAPPNIDVSYIPASLILSEQERLELGIEKGDKVFILSSLRTKRIVRVGVIAMCPDEKLKIATQEAVSKKVGEFVVQAFVPIGTNFSGSPVFARSRVDLRKTVTQGTSCTQPVVRTDSTLYLIGLGLMCASWWGNPKSGYCLQPNWGTNLGMRVVLPAHKIVETIYGPELTARRRDKVDECIDESKVDEPKCSICNGEFCEHKLCRKCATCKDCEIADEIMKAEGFNPPHSAEKPNLEAYDRRAYLNKRK